MSRRTLRIGPYILTYGFRGFEEEFDIVSRLVYIGRNQNEVQAAVKPT
jgi:hypothetical protein